jgi:ribokinase
MPNVYVVGSINMDIVARTARHPKPGETVPGKGAATYPGGKGANQAVASSKAGARTFMVGRVGGDTFGPELKEFLRAQGVSVEHVKDTDGVPTGVALIVVDDAGENTIVVVPGANGLVVADDFSRVPVAKGDIVLSQFEIPLDTIAAVFRRCRDMGATTILNPAPAMRCPRELLELVDILLVNETELGVLSNASVNGSVASVAKAARNMRTSPEQKVIATLGAEGVLAIFGTDQAIVEGHKVNVVDTTAAGDTFAGALAARLAAGGSFEAALSYANAAAAICVQRPGAGPSIPSSDEVERMLEDVEAH